MKREGKQNAGEKENGIGREKEGGAVERRQKRRDLKEARDRERRKVRMGGMGEGN